MLNNDRLFHWFVGGLLSWIGCSLVVFIPIFHLGLGFPIAQIVVCASIGCAVQLVFTPRLFFARVTNQNPTGNIPRRATTVVWWMSTTALLLLYYVQRFWPRTPETRTFLECAVGTIIGAAVLALIAIRKWSAKI
jgi:hypothetical protein